MDGIGCLGVGVFSLGFQEPQHFVVSWLQLQPRCFASQAVNACLLWMRLLGFCLRGSSFCLGASVFKPGLLFQISRIRFEQKATTNNLHASGGMGTRCGVTRADS